MLSNTRGRRALVRGAFGAVLLLAGLNACTAVAGGAAVLGAVGIAALTSRCHDYVDVTVLDADGRKTCAATVTATNGKSQFELPSCYNASLTDGHWTVRASLAGSTDARTTLVVDHAHDCTRYVQTVELTLNRAGSPTPARRSLDAPAVASPPEPAPPPPTKASPSPSPQPTQSAEPVPASPPAGPASALPMSSAAPSVGVFPDSSQPPR